MKYERFVPSPDDGDLPDNPVDEDDETDKQDKKPAPKGDPHVAKNRIRKDPVSLRHPPKSVQFK